MGKIFLIAAQHVRQIAFWLPFLLSLLLGPPLVVYGAMLMGWVLQGNAPTDLKGLTQTLQSQIVRGTTEIQNIGYVDHAGILRAVPDPNAFQHFIPYTDETRAQNALIEKQIAGYYIIPRDYIEVGEIGFYSVERTMETANDTLFERWIVWNLARGEGAEKAVRVAQPFQDIQIENAANGLPSFLRLTLTREMTVGIGIAALFLFVLVLIGNVFLTPLAREREAKILDVVLGSVSPTQFLLGKFFGALVICAMLFGSWFGWWLMLQRGGNVFGDIDGLTGVFVGALSISGFLMYAALFAVFGAWVELYSESNRIPLLVGTLGLLPLFGLLYTNALPNEASARALSLASLFAPTVMSWRVLLVAVPVAEVLGAIGLMWLATILLLVFAVRWFERRVVLESRVPFWRRGMQKKYLVWGAALVWGTTLLYFVFHATAELTWNDLGVALLSALASCIWIGLYAQRFTAWRALGLLLLAHLLTQVWLQWQWDLWGTRWENVNAVVALLAVDTFAAILVVSALLLIRRDASVWALAVVWLGCPLGLLLSMFRYSNMAQIENLPLRDSSVMLAVMCLLGFLALGGILAFCAHFLRLLYLELAGKT